MRSPRALALVALLAFPAGAGASAPPGPPERIIVRIRDAYGAPVPGASVLALEGTTAYLRQALVRADSNGVAVTDVGPEAYLGLRVMAYGYETWKLELAPGSPDRKRKVIEVRLRRQPKPAAVPVEER